MRRILSIKWSLCIAEIIPNKTPIKTAIIIDDIAKITVLGKVSLIILFTGFPNF